MVLTKKVEQTPYEVWHGQALKMSYLKVWGLKGTCQRDTLTNLTSIRNQRRDTHPSIDTSLNQEEDDQKFNEPQSDINPIRRYTKTHHPTDRMCLYIDAEEHELDNEVIELVELPPNGKTIGSKWLFKKKTDMDGAVHTYKARFVAKGYT
ncbi:zinc finger, CCHC-type containing protein [Tanacetum coccineum]